MGDPQGELSVVQKAHQKPRVLLPCQGKVQLGPDLGEAALGVGLGRVLKLLYAHGGVVEVLDYLVQGAGGIARKLGLEVAEGPARFKEHTGAVGGLVGGGAVYMQGAAPVVAVLVDVKGLSGGGVDDLQYLPLGIAAPGQHLLTKELCDAQHVVHDIPRVREDEVVYPL